MRTMLALAALLLLCSCTPRQLIRGVSGQAEINAWNAVCGAYNFDLVPTGGQTFNQSYNAPMFDTVGFAGNFSGVKQAWAGAMNVAIPEWDGADLVDTTLESY
jgi:hypothetical protein